MTNNSIQSKVTATKEAAKPEVKAKATMQDYVKRM